MQGRGKTAVRSNRPPNQVSVLNAPNNKESNQEQFTPAGPIKPTTLQPRQLSKRVSSLRLPVNYNA